MTKYNPLSQHFRDLGGQAWHATFEDIERILGFPLPNSARAHQAWWANSADNAPQKSTWLNAGWRTRDLNLSAGHVLFVRQTGAIAVTPHAMRLLPTDAGGASRSPATALHDWETAQTVECRLRIAGCRLGGWCRDAAGRFPRPRRCRPSTDSAFAGVT